MQNYELSSHAKTVKLERKIQQSWIDDAFYFPDKIIEVDYDEVHYLKKTKEFGNRYLRLVVNPLKEPNLIITVFFDRRLK